MIDIRFDFCAAVSYVDRDNEAFRFVTEIARDSIRESRAMQFNVTNQPFYQEAVHLYPQARKLRFQILAKRFTRPANFGNNR